MQITYNTKVSSPERLKSIGEKLTRRIVELGFTGDIECVGVLQELLSSTGADPVAIQNEMNANVPEG